eukprot:TRINITY_DN3167_c0_g1_i4.p1 TRINITY_DN3167_c0_g1~~TRINITY_DN3167_c0_g1_i4.p1  ORF type:complete len:146 (+),score=27.21 TRINITY_DN3167_c0_g1_i4:512-949(+)
MPPPFLPTFLDLVLPFCISTFSNYDHPPHFSDCTLGKVSSDRLGFQRCTYEHPSTQLAKVCSFKELCNTAGGSSGVIGGCNSGGDGHGDGNDDGDGSDSGGWKFSRLFSFSHKSEKKKLYQSAISNINDVQEVARLIGAKRCSDG